MTCKEISAVFDLVGVSMGRCFGSKSVYREYVQPNAFLPNANIFVTSGTVSDGSRKIWHGDLDILRDGQSLIAVSRLLNRKLFILREGDGRWGHETSPHRVVRRNALATVWRGCVNYSESVGYV